MYRYFDLPYNTPFIGLFLMGPCYLEFLRDPKYYISQELVFHTQSKYEEVNQVLLKKKYPLATLGGKVEISFLHYNSIEEAKTKWQRRASRINWDNLLVKLDGSKDAATPELAKEFTHLPYKNLLLVKSPINGINKSVVIPDYTNDGALMFKRSILHFDLANWINTGNPAFSWSSKLLQQVLGVG